LPRECIGAIKLLPRQTLVDVAEEHAELVLKKLHGIRFKGEKLFARRALELSGSVKMPEKSVTRPKPHQKKPPKFRSGN
jgi:hypothetical protein